MDATLNDYDWVTGFKDLTSSLPMPLTDPTLELCWGPRAKGYRNSTHSAGAVLPACSSPGRLHGSQADLHSKAA